MLPAEVKTPDTNAALDAPLPRHKGENSTAYAAVLRKKFGISGNLS